MSETNEPEGIVYVGEDGLAEEDPLSPGERAYVEETLASVENLSLPDSDEETPPDPGVLVVKGAYGPGTFSAKWPDGTPLGTWLEVEYPDATSQEVEALLLDVGLEPALAAWFASNRIGAVAARAELSKQPAVQAFAQAEELHDESTAAMREAFLKAHKAKPQ